MSIMQRVKTLSGGDHDAGYPEHLVTETDMQSIQLLGR